MRILYLAYCGKNAREASGSHGPGSRYLWLAWRYVVPCVCVVAHVCVCMYVCVHRVYGYVCIRMSLRGCSTRYLVVRILDSMWGYWTNSMWAPSIRHPTSSWGYWTECWLRGYGQTLSAPSVLVVWHVICDSYSSWLAKKNTVGGNMCMAIHVSRI